MAKKVQRIESVHGEELVDDYFWLRDREDPDVRAYLDAENAYTDSIKCCTVKLALGPAPCTRSCSTSSAWAFQAHPD